MHTQERGVPVFSPPDREATPATPPSRSRATGASRRPRFRHITSLDGLRGMAVAAVVVYHFAPDVAPGGFLGVDLFFVLSGFLITSLLVNEWRGTHGIAFASFWMRRARRLLPALFLILAAVAVYELFVADPVDAHHVASDGLWSTFYMANWHFIASGQSYIQQFLFIEPSPLRHMWSLAIEEQFYLVWPLVVFGVGALASRRGAPQRGQYQRFRRYLLLACVVLGVVSFMRMVTLFHPGDDPSRVYYGTDSRAFIVLIGAVVGVLSAGVPIVKAGVRRLVLVVAGLVAALALLVAVLTVHIDSTFLYDQGGYLLIGLAMVLVLVAAAQPGPNVIGAFLRWRPLVGLGLISYGVYLWHWPIGLWVDEDNTPFSGFSLFVVRCVLTLAVSLASYYLIEMPIRKGALSRLGPTTRNAVTAVTAVVVVVLFVVPLVVFPSSRTVPTKVALSAGADDVTAGYASAPRCDQPGDATPIADKSLLIQLEGNSIAGEIRNCLGTILERRGAELEGVNPPGFLLCKAAPAIRKQTLDPKTKPDAAILFVFVAYDNRCGSPWHATVDWLLAMWKKAGVHVYLVPSVPFVPGTPQADQMAPGPLEEAQYYKQVADADPEHVTLLDAGTFLRDATGEYVWRMPCLAGGEPGCDRTTDTVGVRYVDGLHFCTDPDFAAHGCEGAIHQAGERRAAAAVASGLITSLQQRLGARG